MAKVRVLVVDDSLTVRKRIAEVLAGDGEIEVVGEAADGQLAIALCQSLRPDVITLDMMLPVMSGLETTEYIMAHCPTPILIVSASTNRGELFRTYDALAAGAVDVLEKAAKDDPSWDRRLVSTVKLVSRIKVITHPRAKIQAFVPREARRATAPASRLRAIGLGASTGGPAAIVEVLRGLPSTFPLPILLVLHLGEPFAAAFADWLDGSSPVRVAYAADSDPVPPVGQGRVLLAPPNRHMVVRHGRIRLTCDPERHSCRPSVDELFESMAREWGARSAACILTGMGKDGAAGLLEVRRAGGVTIAQDEATSVVFGMPHEAILLGAAERVLAVGEIAAALRALAADSAPGGSS